MVTDVEKDRWVDGYGSVSAHQLEPPIVSVCNLSVWRVTYRAEFYCKDAGYQQATHQAAAESDVLIATTGDSLIALKHAIAARFNFPGQHNAVSIERAEYLGETI